MLRHRQFHVYTNILHINSGVKSFQNFEGFYILNHFEVQRSVFPSLLNIWYCQPKQLTAVKHITGFINECSDGWSRLRYLNTFWIFLLCRGWTLQILKTSCIRLTTNFTCLRSQRRWMIRMQLFISWRLFEEKKTSLIGPNTVHTGHNWWASMSLRSNPSELYQQSVSWLLKCDGSRINRMFCFVSSSHFWLNTETLPAVLSLSALMHYGSRLPASHCLSTTCFIIPFPPFLSFHLFLTPFISILSCCVLHILQARQAVYTPYNIQHIYHIYT